MHLMYVDEAGDLAILNSPAAPNDQPIFILGGLLVAADRVRSFTTAYLAAKRRFFPKLSPSKHHFDWMLAEVKGTSLKKSALAPSRNQRRHARLFLGSILGIVEEHGGRLLARIWIKEPQALIKHASVYTYSVQSLCSAFDRYMGEGDSRGMCIADFRTQALNSKVAHSLFTQQYGFAERYQRLEEVPVFGDSNNHAGLQVCDIIVSAILMPIACKAYCDKHVRNVHVQNNALELRDLYGERIRALQYRYNKPGTSKFMGGISVSDPVGKRDGSLMFAGPL
jgi:hypothetical protein